MQPITATGVVALRLGTGTTAMGRITLTVADGVTVTIQADPQAELVAITGDAAVAAHWRAILAVSSGLPLEDVDHPTEDEPITRG